MEGIREQLVAKPHTNEDRIKSILVSAASVLLGAIILLFLIRTIIAPLGILLAGLVIWGGMWLTGRFNVEYEYLITGGELSVDKIYNKRSRKPLCSMKLRSAEGFYQAEKRLSDATVIDVCGEGEKYTIEYSDPKYGKTLLIFTPDERTLEVISPYLPRLIK